MTHCPQCGHNMYPEDEAGVVQEKAAYAPMWLTILGGVLIGWIVAGGIAFVVHLIVSNFVTASNLGGLTRAVLFISGPLGALAGGYLCAAITGRRQTLLGGIVGVFALPIVVLLTTHWYEVTFNLLLTPTLLASAVLTVLCGVTGGWLCEIFAADTDWREKWRVRGWEDLLYQDLLRKVRFNGSIADRLIDYERKQDPQASRLKLIQNAIERWEEDNR